MNTQKILTLTLALLGFASFVHAQKTPVPDHFSDWTGKADGNYLNPANWNGGIVPEGATAAIRLLGDPAIPNKHITYTHTGDTEKTLQLYSIQTSVNKAYTLEFSNTGTNWLIVNPVGRGFTFNGQIGATSVGSSFDITRPDTTGDAATRLAVNVTLNSYTRMTLDGSTAGARLAASGLALGLFTLNGNARIDVSKAGDLPFVWANGVTNAVRTATVEIGGLQTAPATEVYVGSRNVSINAGMVAGQTSLMAGLFYGVNTGNATCDVFGDITHMTGIVNFTGDGRARFLIRGSRAQYIVDGVHNGGIDVWSGATAGGSGVINGSVSVQAGAQLTPARKGTASDAALTINGNVGLSGNLSFDLITDKVYDRLKINGTLNIHSPAHPTSTGDANLVIGLAKTFPIVSGSYNLMTIHSTGTNTPIVGDFADSHVSFPVSMSIKSSWGWTDIKEAYNEELLRDSEVERTLFVTFEQMRFDSSPLLAGKYLTTATVVDDIYAQTLADPSLHTIYEPLFDSLNRQRSIILYQNVLDQLTPSTYQAWFPSAIVRANTMVLSVEDRMYQDAAFKRKKGTVQTFLEGYGQEASRGKSNLAAYSNYAVVTAIAGVDYAFRENIVAGLFTAYETTNFDLDTAGGTCDVNSYTFGLNMRYLKGRFQGNLTAFVGTDDYKSSRSVALTQLATWADADTSGSRVGAAASIAYSIPFSWFEITPEVGAQMLDWDADGFDERNANEANLKVYSQNATSLQGKFGLRIAQSYKTKMGVLRPFFHYAWLHEFDNESRTISADLFGQRIDIEAPGTNGDGWRLDLGVDWSASRKCNVYLRYHSEYRSAAGENVGIRGGVTYTF